MSTNNDNNKTFLENWLLPITLVVIGSSLCLLFINNICGGIRNAKNKISENTREPTHSLLFEQSMGGGGFGSG